MISGTVEYFNAAKALLYGHTLAELTCRRIRGREENMRVSVYVVDRWWRNKHNGVKYTMTSG
jgi:hypothetical protein